MAVNEPSAYLTRSIPTTSWGTTRPMTRAGTYAKTGGLLALLTLVAAVAYAKPPGGGTVLAALVVGVAAALIGTWRPRAAVVAAPVYAVAQGVVLGWISHAFADGQVITVRGARLNGTIVPEAVILTGAVAVACWVLYASGLVRVTRRFTRTVVVATAGVMVFYVVDLVARLVTHGAGGAPLVWSSSAAGILFSLVVVTLAAANLIMDFDFIESCVARGVDARYEWVASLGLVVALVWLYLEILRLLAKLSQR